MWVTFDTTMLTRCLRRNIIALLPHRYHDRCPLVEDLVVLPSSSTLTAVVALLASQEEMDETFL